MNSINFDTSVQAFRDILGNGSSYEVPRFQRDYAWGMEQWQDLWLDIHEVIIQSKEEHYMGYLVLQQKQKDNYQIIDGQQRMTTVSLLIIAGLYYLKELIENGEQDQENQQRLDALRRSYIGDLDAVSLKTKNKLTLNRNNQDYFRTYLTSLNKAPVSRIKKSEKLLKEACDFFRAKLEEKKFTGEQLAEFISSMTRGLVFTTIRVGSEVNAYRVFETLNSRGVQLSTPDLFKNFLFSSIDQDHTLHNTRLDDIEMIWSQILVKLGRLDFTDYLRTEWNRRQPLTRKGGLFKSIKSTIKTPQNSFEQLNLLNETAEVYSALHDYHSEFWKVSGLHLEERLKNTLGLFQLFHIKQPFGLLLSAWQKWPIDDFLKLLQAIGIISFRYNVICQKSPNEQERLYNSIARSIYHEKKTFTEVLSLFKPVYPSQEEFRENFSRRSFPSKQSNKKPRWILARIASQLQQDLGYDETQFTLEHILPQTLNEEWETSFQADSPQDFIDRLGNMTLVSTQQNKQLGRENFEQKKRMLLQSNIQLNQQLQDYSEWQAEQIEHRQNWLAQQAASIWCIGKLEGHL